MQLLEKMLRKALLHMTNGAITVKNTNGQVKIMSNNILKQIVNLKSKSTKELEELYTSLYSEKPTLNSKQQLIRDIAYRLQELEYGFLSEKHNKKLDSLVKEAAKGKKFCKAKYYKPVNGTKICKEYHDQKYEVKTASEGFMYNGLIYKSLSVLATKITGHKTNGLLFFGVKK
jgi:hypothetical protein